MTNKKLLLIAKCHETQYTYASSFYTTFQSLGYQVTLVNYNQQYHLANKLLERTQQLAHTFFINQQIKSLATSLQPDIIFILKGELIQPATISYLKQHCTSSIAIFYPDNPFTFWNGNANKNLLLSLPYYDYFLIWSHMLIPALQSAGARNVQYFPFAYDEKIFKPRLSITSDEHKAYDADVNFLGTWDPQREWWLTNLINRMPMVKLAIWGNRWKEQLSESSPLHAYWRGSAIYTEEMIKALRCAKITLNFIRQQNMTSHNMRTFEALATNTFMLTERTTEQTTQPFEEGTNIECFSSLEELTKKIAFYLDNDTLRNSIAYKGHVLAQEFTLHKQLKALLQGIEDERSA